VAHFFLRLKFLRAFAVLNLYHSTIAVDITLPLNVCFIDNLHALNNNSQHTEMFPVMEHFYTLQGEGFYQGKAAYFVRLGGCEVGCPWCDVKESWLAEKHPLWEAAAIAREVSASGAEICVITGGEPLMYNLNTLTALLQKQGIRTHLETSGAYPLSGSWNWVCISPKRYKLPLQQCLDAANELKIIVAHRNDFRFAEEFADKVSPTCKLYLQPEWSMAEEMTDVMINYVKTNQRWTVSLQIHKFLNVP
jgi:organic radical activating enzyme